jgi:ribosomal protein S18 acetylase RimI-like enzyme
VTALDRKIRELRLTVTLRPAVYTDLPKLEWFGEYTHFRSLFARTYQEQKLGRRLMLLADLNDFPIGQIFLHLKPAYNSRFTGNHAYLYAFRVMDMFRGQGIGSWLLDEAETIAAGQGNRWTTIAVAKDNPGALRLYQRHGYRVYAEDAGQWNYVDHQGKTRYVDEPCWLLEKSLEGR